MATYYTEPCERASLGTLPTPLIQQAQVYNRSQSSSIIAHASLSQSLNYNCCDARNKTCFELGYAARHHLH